MRRAALTVAVLLLVGAGVAASFGRTSSGPAASAVREGGTFRIAYFSSDVTVDPALPTVFGEALLQATCAKLMNYRDRSSPAGLQIVPEVAAAYPRVSRDGRTYTFTLRRGLRFSDGSPVTAESFARAFVRVLAPSMRSYGAVFLEDVVGAKGAAEGTVPAGVRTQGNRLVVRLTRPAPDFPNRMALTVFCAVPPNLPIDPEGVGAPLHSAGPYYVAEFVRDRRIVLERNRFYRGSRPHHVDRFVVDLDAAGPLDTLARVQAGTADWTLIESRLQFSQLGELARRYGVNRTQLFLTPGLYLVGFHLNTRGPLFRNNPQLRRAVNFAVDRPALLREVGMHAGGVTDQYLPPAAPGFRDARIYPLRGPDLARARALARGHLRSGKAVVYISDDRPLAAQAQILQRNLAAIGLDVEIKQSPTSAHFAKLFRRGEPWDIGSAGWYPEYPDPSQYLNVLFGSGSSANPGFRSPTFDRLLARAAGLRGSARYRAYATLDARLAREAAPYLAVSYSNNPTLVSSRVDRRCVVLRPELDLAAACLKG